MPLPEKELIARVRRRLRQPRAPEQRKVLMRGIGDDCAVLRVPRGHELLVTTDFSLEGVHFRRDWHGAEGIGERCLTRGLSDIAAMGGAPLAVFLSLALPAKTPQSWVDGFTRGFLQLARHSRAPLAGGDTARSPAGIAADVIVVGSVPKGKAVLRSGAQPGDDLYVTGSLGAPMAELRRLAKPASRSWRRPERNLRRLPRIEVGGWLRERRLPTAMIDISDGLSTDLNHICEESGVGAWIAQSEIPVAPGATLEDALHGGDEYELLFSASPGRRRRVPARVAGVAVHWIGTVTRERGMWLIAPDGISKRSLSPAGWEHFR